MAKKQPINWIDRSSSYRAGNAAIRLRLAEATKAVKAGDWRSAHEEYSAIVSLAETLLHATEARWQREVEAQV